MTCQSSSKLLDDDEKRQVCAILSVGGDRQTAAACIGCSRRTLRRTIRCDPQFAADVIRAEASAELSHVRNVHKAARDEKHWRASTWWLERRRPQRFARSDPGKLTASQVESLIATLADLVVEEVRDAADCRRLLGRLRRMVKVLDEMSHDVPSDEPMPPPQLPSPHDESPEESWS